eukprot:8628622-Ditylum_brightwellii.AAC.1
MEVWNMEFGATLVLLLFVAAAEKYNGIVSCAGSVSPRQATHKPVMPNARETLSRNSPCFPSTATLISQATFGLFPEISCANAEASDSLP